MEDKTLLVILDCEGRVLRFNAACEALSGYHAEDIEGKAIWEVLPPPEDRDCVRAHATSRLLGTDDKHEAGYYTNVWQTRNGERRLINWRNALLHDETGAVERLVCIGEVVASDESEQTDARFDVDLERVATISRDVAQQRQVTELLTASNQILNAVFDATPLLIAYCDPAFVCVQVNQAYATANGGMPEDFIGRNLFEIYPDPENEAIIRDMFARGEPYIKRAKAFDYAAIPARGTTYWDWSLVPVKNTDGVVVGAVLSLLDVTSRVTSQLALERKNTILEKDLREMAADALQHHRRMEVVLETALDGLVIGTVTAEITDVNPAFCTMLDYERTAIIGRNFADFHAPANDPDTSARVAEILAAGFCRFESRLRRRDGGLVDVLVSARRAEFGDETILFAFVCDISERKAAEAALLAAKEEAERTNSAKSEFMSRMSHELRTPMNAILGFAQILQTTPLSADQRDYAHEIESASAHLARLVDDLLDISRIEAGKLEVKLEPLRIHQVVHEAIQIVQPLLASSKLAINHAYRAAGNVLGDRIRVRQIIVNLLTNAAKYAAAGETVTIRVEVLPTERLRLKLRDHGPGVPMERIADLFKPFERLGAEHGHISGSGIGLALSKQLALLMNGDLGATNVPGGGLEVWLELPLTASCPEPLPVSPDFNDVLGAANYRLLYIEDNRANTRLAQALFHTLENIELICADTGHQGLMLLDDYSVDAILLDINLPDMDGYAVLDAIRARPALSGIPVIALSADAMPRDLARGERAGFAEYLTKPIDTRRLLATLRAVLSQRACR
ncbi:MAG: PAS domain S-box protein [Dehalococcoidia bacterium]